MKKVHLLLAIILGLSLSACNPKYYSPNTQNVPLISHKGAIDLNLCGNGNQVEFQGAYGLSKNIALQANTSFFVPTDQSDGNGGSGQMLELGVGYYRPVETNFVFETYGLLGFGSLENHLPSTISSNPGTTGNIRANVFRFGIQPNLGFKSKFFTVAISSRFVNLSYNNISGNLIFSGEDQVSYLKQNASNFLIEPAITIRGGIKNVKLQMQYLYSANLSNRNFRQDVGLVSLGLNVNLR